MRISDWSSDVCSSDLQLNAIGNAADEENQIVVEALESLSNCDTNLRKLLTKSRKRLLEGFNNLLGGQDTIISLSEGNQCAATKVAHLILSCAKSFLGNTQATCSALSRNTKVTGDSIRECWQMLDYRTQFVDRKSVV